MHDHKMNYFDTCVLFLKIKGFFFWSKMGREYINNVLFYNTFNGYSNYSGLGAIMGRL